MGCGLVLEPKLKQSFWEFPKGSNTGLPYDTAIPLIGTYPREMKMHTHTKMCTQVSRAALFIIAKKWKPPKCSSTDECINKMIHAYNEYYSAIKRYEVLTQATAWMSLQNITLCRNQSPGTTYYI